MKTKKIIIFTFLTFLMIHFTGCSTKSLYEGVQIGAKQNCHNKPPSEINQCLKNLNTETYEEYKNR